MSNLRNFNAIVAASETRESSEKSGESFIRSPGLELNSMRYCPPHMLHKNQFIHLLGHYQETAYLSTNSFQMHFYTSFQIPVNFSRDLVFAFTRVEI